MGIAWTEKVYKDDEPKNLIMYKANSQVSCKHTYGCYKFFLFQWLVLSGLITVGIFCTNEMYQNYQCMHVEIFKSF